MELLTEAYESSDKILIVTKQMTSFVQMLKEKVSDSHADITITEELPEDYDLYDVIFFIQITDLIPAEFQDRLDKKIIFIFFNEDAIAQTISSYAYDQKLSHIKIINIQSYPEFYAKDIDTLLWFSFSRTVDIFLHIYHPDTKPFPKKKKKELHIRLPQISFDGLLTHLKKPKTMVWLGILLLLITHLMFIPPLLFASYYHYNAGKDLMRRDFNRIPINLTNADSSLRLAESLYSFPKSTFRLFSISWYIEDIIHINFSSNKALHTLVRLQNEGQDFTANLSKPNKSEFEIKRMHAQKEQIFNDIEILNTEISYLKEKVPNWQQTQNIKVALKEASEMLELATTLEPHFDSLFGRDKDRKYLLLFANNMELRPGGGFIGSFGILTMRDYSIKEVRVYDVYDADGQLTEQIDPPEPIVKHLNQTHWYLRDSAFSGDFVDNFRQAETFLEMEMSETDFDGGILFTTTAVQYLLQAMDGLYVPDFKETITKDNFYIKTQLYAEKDFFPGSTQKKRFLGSVMNQMFLGLQDASLPRLLEMTEKSFNEKQMVIYSRDAELQTFFEENYWSGRQLTPKCNQESAYNCILDYSYTLEANLGVNKANYYIQRPTNLTVEIDDSGKIVNTLSIQYKNDSFSDIFPGGNYKNYFQVLIPPNAQINSVAINDEQVKDYEETNFSYKRVAFLANIPPQSTKTIKIEYTLPTTIIKGDGVYQLIFQKQVGSPNYDFKFDFIFPENIKIRNQNLSPLVKNGEIHYNTSISSDKIFLIEFTKN